MEKEQIIKALECLASEKDVLCKGCAYQKYEGLSCRKALAKDALALIKQQDEQIFQLENRLKECENGYAGTLHLESCKLHDAEERVKELTEENESLKEERECPRCRYFVGCECFDGKICDLYTEVVTENTEE